MHEACAANTWDVKVVRQKPGYNDPQALTTPKLVNTSASLQLAAFNFGADTVYECILVSIMNPGGYRITSEMSLCAVVLNLQSPGLAFVIEVAHLISYQQRSHYPQA